MQWKDIDGNIIPEEQVEEKSYKESAKFICDLCLLEVPSDSLQECQVCGDTFCVDCGWVEERICLDCE